MSGTVHPLIGDVHAPGEEVGVQFLQVAEAPAGEGIALDVLHPALDLALGLGPVEAAQTGHDPVEIHPVFEGRVPDHVPGRLVLVRHNRPRVVVEDALRPAPEVGEGRRVAIQQRVEPLAEVGLGKDPPAEAQHHREQVHPDPCLAQKERGRPPVDLGLLSGTGLEAHRRHVVSSPGFPPRRDVLDQGRVTAGVAPLRQLTGQHHGVEAHFRSPDLQKLPSGVELSPSRSARLRPPGSPQPGAHRLHVQSQLPGDPLLRLALLGQGPNRSVHVLVDHLALHGTLRCRGQAKRSLWLFHVPLLVGWTSEGGKLASCMGG